MQNIAWELEVLRVIADNNRFEDRKPKKCACAVRLNFAPRQPRHSSAACSKETSHVSAEVEEKQLRVTCHAKVLSYSASIRGRSGGQLCHGNHGDLIESNSIHRIVNYPCLSLAYGCIVTCGYTRV